MTGHKNQKNFKKKIFFVAMYKKANLFLCIILNFTQTMEIFTGICYNKFNYKILNGGIAYEKFCKSNRIYFSFAGRILFEFPSDGQISEQIQKKLYYN